MLCQYVDTYQHFGKTFQSEHGCSSYLLNSYVCGKMTYSVISNQYLSMVTSEGVSQNATTVTHVLSWNIWQVWVYKIMLGLSSIQKH